MSIVTSKGQVTIPKPIRDRLGLEPGTQAEFVVNSRGEYVLKRADGKPVVGIRERLRDVIGSRPSDMTTDEIMALLRGDD